MGYTKGELVDQAYYRISGGIDNNEISVNKIDIGKYLIAAINYALVEDYRFKLRDNVLAKRSSPLEAQSNPVDHNMLTRFTFSPQFDELRGLHYIELTDKILSLPKNRGLHAAMPLKGNTAYTKIVSQQELLGTERYLSDQVFYWPEHSTSSDVILFKNMQEPIGDVMIFMAVDFDSISDTSNLNLPSGIEVRVLELVVQFFTSQRTIPGDDQNDGNDQIKSRL